MPDETINAKIFAPHMRANILAYSQGYDAIQKALSLQLQAQHPGVNGAAKTEAVRHLALRAAHDITRGEYPIAAVPDLKPISPEHFDAFESGMRKGVWAWSHSENKALRSPEIVKDAGHKTEELLAQVGARFERGPWPEQYLTGEPTGTPRSAMLRQDSVSQKGELKLEEKNQKPVYVEKTEDIEAMARTADGPFSTKTENYDKSAEVYTTALKPEAISRSTEPEPFAYSQESIKNRVHELETQKPAVTLEPAKEIAAKQTDAPAKERVYEHAMEI